MADFNNLFGKDRDVVQETGASVGQKLRVASNGLELEGFELFAESTATLSETIATDDLRDLEGVSMDTATLVVATGVDYATYVGGTITFSADYTTGAEDNDGNNVTAELAGNTFSIVAGSTTNEIRFQATGIDIGSDGTSDSGSVTVDLAGGTTVTGDLTVTGASTLTGLTTGTITESNAVSEFGNETTENTISDQGTTLQFWKGTQAQYDAITTKSNQVIYFIQ